MKKKLIFSVYLATFICILMIFVNRTSSLDFVFGYLLGLFNFYSQVFSLQYIFNKGKKYAKAFILLFGLRYSMISILIIYYLRKYNANIFALFFGIAVVYVSILFEEIIFKKNVSFLKKLRTVPRGDENGEGKTDI